MIDIDSFQQMVEHLVPFVKKVGFEFVAAGPGRAELAFPLDPANLNHVGCYHAGALFTFGETAGGAAMSTAFDMLQYRLLVKAARIKYHKRVTERITCRVEISEEDRNAILQRLEEEDGRTIHVLPVVMRDAEGEPVCELELDYHIKKVR